MYSLSPRPQTKCGSLSVSHILLYWKQYMCWMMSGDETTSHGDHFVTLVTENTCNTTSCWSNSNGCHETNLPPKICSYSCMGCIVLGNEVSSVNSWIISATYIQAYKASSTYSLKLLVQLFLRLQKPKWTGSLTLSLC